MSAVGMPDNTMGGMVEIVPNLYLGNWAVDILVDDLPAQNISTVISIIATELTPSLYQTYTTHDIKRVHFKDHENFGQNILYILQDACKLIKTCTLDNKKRVLIHCGHGETVERALCMVVAYVMRTSKLNRVEALDLVSQKRGQSFQLSEEMDMQLKVWEDCKCDLYAKKNGKMAPKEAFRKWKQSEGIEPSTWKITLFPPVVDV